MVEYHTSKKVYEGDGIHEIAIQVMDDNIKKNFKLAHKPYPEDYNIIYNQIVKSLANANKSLLISKIADQKREARMAAGSITFADSLRGAKAILKMAAGDVVETFEMSRRASICSQCPLSTKNSDCAMCKMGKEVANIINYIRNIAKRGVSYPTVKARRARDMNCGYCGCSMLMILPAKISCFNEPDDKNVNRPDMCWIKRGGINFVSQT